MNKNRLLYQKIEVKIAVVMTSWILFAGSSLAGSTKTTIANQEKPYFAGVNLLSPVPSLLPVPGNTLFSVLSNLECGFGMSGGLFVRNNQALELRLAYGPNSKSERIFNSQAYYSYYFRQNTARYFKGAYAGAGVRYWDLYNQLTGVHRNTMAGEIAVGYRFSRKGPLYIDLRMSEIVGIYSWLSAEHTTGGWASLMSPSMPKMPLISIDAGWQFR